MDLLITIIVDLIVLVVFIGLFFLVNTKIFQLYFISSLTVFDQDFPKLVYWFRLLFKLFIIILWSSFCAKSFTYFVEDQVHKFNWLHVFIIYIVMDLPFRVMTTLTREMMMMNKYNLIFESELLAFRLTAGIIFAICISLIDVANFFWPIFP